MKKKRNDLPDHESILLISQWGNSGINLNKNEKKLQKKEEKKLQKELDKSNLYSGLMYDDKFKKCSFWPVRSNLIKKNSAAGEVYFATVQAENWEKDFDICINKLKGFCEQNDIEMLTKKGFFNPRILIKKRKGERYPEFVLKK